MSLQSRYSGNIISIFPIIVLVLLYIFMNKTILDFFSTGMGIILLFIGGILEVAGIIVIKKITGTGE
jgi:Flp pilus assembly protein TadB